jgi:hypothetical protein
MLAPVLFVDLRQRGLTQRRGKGVMPQPKREEDHSPAQKRAGMIGQSQGSASWLGPSEYAANLLVSSTILPPHFCQRQPTRSVTHVERRRSETFTAGALRPSLRIRPLDLPTRFDGIVRLLCANVRFCDCPLRFYIAKKLKK